MMCAVIAGQESLRAERETIHLPVYPGLTDRELHRVVEGVKKVAAAGGTVAS